MNITFGSSAPEWFQVLQSIGIIASLVFSGYALIREARSRRLGNYLKIIEYHRDIWRMTMEMDGLDRIRSRDQSLHHADLTLKESQFLTFVFLHITCSYELVRNNHLVNIEQLRFDIGEMMKAPIVLSFWRANRIYYNDDFRKFVESCLTGDSRAILFTGNLPPVLPNPTGYQEIGADNAPAVGIATPPAHG